MSPAPLRHGHNSANGLEILNFPSFSVGFLMFSTDGLTLSISFFPNIWFMQLSWLLLFNNQRFTCKYEYNSFQWTISNYKAITGRQTKSESTMANPLLVHAMNSTYANEAGWVSAICACATTHSAGHLGGGRPFGVQFQESIVH